MRVCNILKQLTTIGSHTHTYHHLKSQTAWSDLKGTWGTGWAGIHQRVLGGGWKQQTRRWARKPGSAYANQAARSRWANLPSFLGLTGAP